MMNYDKFKRHYSQWLAKEIAERPPKYFDSWVYKEGAVKAAEILVDALRDGGGSIATTRSTCDALGVKYSKSAIRSFLNGD